MIETMPDNYEMWEAHESEMELMLSRRPKCDYCFQHIQDDHYYEIEGEIFCPDCMESVFRKEVEDFDE